MVAPGRVIGEQLFPFCCPVGLGFVVIPHIVAGVIYYAIILAVSYAAWCLFGRDDE